MVAIFVVAQTAREKLSACFAFHLAAPDVVLTPDRFGIVVLDKHLLIEVLLYPVILLVHATSEQGGVEVICARRVVVIE